MSGKWLEPPEMTAHPSKSQKTPAVAIRAWRPMGRFALLACAGLLIVTACSNLKITDDNEGYIQRVGSKGSERAWGATQSEAEEKFSGGEAGIFSAFTEKKGNGSGGGIGVNSFLWRATLETISFMPVSAADPFGGVIITDWLAPVETPNERFKLNVYIIGRVLRADGVKVAVFRQMRNPSSGAWQDASTPRQTATSVEDAILMKARQIRNSVAPQ
jgi:hypothetical protein